MDYNAPITPKTGERLGNGSFGVAYAISDTVVLKVTADELEVNIARRMIGHTFRRVWEVYHVRPLTPGEQKAFSGEHSKFRRDQYTLYAIFGERLYPMGRKVSQKAYAYWQGDAYAPLNSWKAEARAELQRIGLDHRDMHPGNMAQTKGGKGHGRPRIKFIDVRAYC